MIEGIGDSGPYIDYIGYLISPPSLLTNKKEEHRRRGGGLGDWRPPVPK